jgi:NADH pyrophosphatase NudC (nudix superfamily)
MGKIEGIFDEVLFMAKSAVDVAGKKTGEVVEIGKLKYQLKQVEWDLEKAYAKLGAITYEARQGGGDLEDAQKLAVEEIDGLKRKAEDCEEALRGYRKVKKCAKCGQENESTAIYCVRCGSLIEPPGADPTPANEEENPDSE